jgi:hypothetical protein
MFVRRRPLRSTRGIVLETNKGKIGERRDDYSEYLLRFQSVSDIVEYQPDPYVLKRIATELKSFQQRAVGYHIPDDFIGVVAQGIVDGLRRLDALPRDHPFWDQSNRRPTLGKLKEFSDYLLRNNPRDLSALHTAIAYEILTFQNFQPKYWIQLHAEGKLHISWPIYTALLLGPDGFQALNLAHFLNAEELYDQAMTILGELMHSQDRAISEWATKIVNICSDLNEHTRQQTASDWP